MNMTSTFLRSLIVASLLSPAAHAAWQGSAAADYAVKATMDSFVGKVTSEPIVIADDATEVQVTFLISKMDSGKKKRDVEMQHMFHAEQHPEIVGTAQAENLLGLQADGEVPLRLTISGVTQEVPAKISHLVRTEGKLSFTANLEISLKSFGLKPPSIMKIINVGDLVKVTTTVELTSGATPSPQL